MLRNVNTYPRAWTEVLDLPKMALGKWDNIAMDLKEVEWMRFNWSGVVWDRDTRRTSVNTVMNCLGPYNP
jgi:hypothetical protein